MADYLYKEIHSSSLVAGTAGVRSIVPPSGETWLIVEANLVPNVAVTADDTDYNTYEIALNNDFSTYPCCTAKTTQITGGAADVVCTVKTLTLNSDVTKRTATAALPITFKVLKTGAGKAHDVTLCIKIVRRPA